MSTRIRCAIYTRKSTEDGLEQEFNSLQAQREACEAFIQSQRGVGWVALAAPYDDGGLSGGTLDRPALQALLGDIAERRVDLVVVYKVDRLTRSLADFAKIVEVFDGHGVSFVSVTQQFNTTTSMGRLTLNMLLSFAQFEREVTGERIRDKIAASKKKGMWMGGLPPLGYDVRDRKLVVNETEADTVRQLFELYVKLGSVRSLKSEADRLGLVTKRRNHDCKVTGGKPFSRGNLYQLLHNVLFVGEIAHKGETFPGQHDPIIDRETWDTAQDLLSCNAPARRSDTNIGDGHLLKGRVFDEAGDPLCPTHAVKKGRRYRYYVSKRLLHAPDRDDNGWRLPARELEQAVRDSVRAFLQDEARLVDALSSAGSMSRSIGRLIEGAGVLGAKLGNDGPADVGKLGCLVHRVTVGSDVILIEISEHILRQLIIGECDDRAGETDCMLRIRVAASFRRRGVETKLVLRSPDYEVPDEKLIALIARSFEWLEQLSAGDVGSIREIARRDGLDESDVSRFLPLAYLAPDIVEAIITGNQPTELTSEVLRHACPISYLWEAQRAVLRFAKYDVSNEVTVNVENFVTYHCA